MTPSISNFDDSMSSSLAVDSVELHQSEENPDAKWTSKIRNFVRKTFLRVDNDARPDPRVGEAGGSSSNMPHVLLDEEDSITTLTHDGYVVFVVITIIIDFL